MMKPCDIIIYCSVNYQKLSKLTDLFSKLKFTLHHLSIESLLDRAWLSSTKYLIVEDSVDSVFTKQKLGDLVNNVLRNADNRIIMISDRLLQFPDSMMTQRLNEEVVQVKQDAETRMFVFKNVEAMEPLVEIVRKTWNLLDESEAAAAVVSQSSDVFAIAQDQVVCEKVMATLGPVASKIGTIAVLAADKDQAAQEHEGKYCSRRLWSFKAAEGGDGNPCNFDGEGYFRHLATKELGQVVLFADLLNSSYTMIEQLLEAAVDVENMLIMSAGQLKGKGRGSNSWISPLGCCMFSSAICIALNSNLGSSFSIIQHIIALSITEAITFLCQLPPGQLVIKWPNDVHWQGHGKVAGIVSKGRFIGDQVNLLIGCGVNVSNSDPTVCVHDIVRQVHSEGDTANHLVSTEAVAAACLTRLECNIDLYQTSLTGAEEVRAKYCGLWMHSNQRVEFREAQATTASANLSAPRFGTIMGIDEYGYLLLKPEEGGSIIPLHPDGNSFDMLHNLILPKTT